MAAIQKIRGMAGLLVGVIGVALLAFILGDFFNSGTAFFQKSQDKAFVVDGDIISTRDYQLRISEWEEFEKANNGLTTLDANASMRIREMVYQQMVKEKMLDDQAEKLGITVTPEELSDIIYGDGIMQMMYRMRVNIFSDPQTGQFDTNRLAQFLEYTKQDTSGMVEEQKYAFESQKAMWNFLLNRIKYTRLEEKYASLVAASTLVSETEAKASFEDTKYDADLAYVLNSYANLSDSAVNVSDADVKALYEKRKSNFKLDTKLRSISYFVKDIVPSENDFAVVDKEIQKAYTELQNAENPGLVVNQYSENQYLDLFNPVSALPEQIKIFVEANPVNQIFGPAREGQSFVLYKIVDKTVAPDSVDLQMISLPPALSLDFKTTNHIIDSLHNEIKKGKSFADIADEMMPGMNGGKLGKVSEMQLASAGIAKECFAAGVNEVVKVTIQGQPQLIKILSKSAPVAKVKLAYIQMPVIISEKTQNGVDNELTRFITENGTIDKFSKEAQEKGYAIVPNATISASDPSLGQEPDSRTVIHWAFNEAKGTVKKFDLTNKRIVSIIDSEIEDKFVPYNEVKDALKAELIRDKKAEKLIADMKAKNLNSLDGYAQSLSSKVDTVKFVNFQTNNITGVGVEPVINVYSEIGQPNQVSQPLKGNMGVFVLSVINKTQKATEYNTAQVKQGLRQANFYQNASQSIVALKEKMNVEDNRVKFW